MWILLKNALARLFRSPVQSIAALVASFIITSASILSLFLPDIIKANNRTVVNAATAGFDILFAGTSVQEEDSARFSSFADKLIEEGRSWTPSPLVSSSASLVPAGVIYLG